MNYITVVLWAISFVNSSLALILSINPARRWLLIHTTESQFNWTLGVIFALEVSALIWAVAVSI